MILLDLSASHITEAISMNYVRRPTPMCPVIILRVSAAAFSREVLGDLHRFLFHWNIRCVYLKKGLKMIDDAVLIFHATFPFLGYLSRCLWVMLTIKTLSSLNHSLLLKSMKVTSSLGSLCAPCVLYTCLP